MRLLEHVAIRFAETVGSSWAFLIALLLASSWLYLTGMEHTSRNPRLFIIELTGVFIFLHLFLIQRIHNKDMKAIHLKLDELIASKDGANNSLIKAEIAPEKVLDELHEAYEELAEATEHPTNPVTVKKAIDIKRNTNARA